MKKKRIRQFKYRIWPMIIVLFAIGVLAACGEIEGTSALPPTPRMFSVEEGGEILPEEVPPPTEITPIPEEEELPPPIEITPIPEEELPPPSSDFLVPSEGFTEYRLTVGRNDIKLITVGGGEAVYPLGTVFTFTGGHLASAPLGSMVLSVDSEMGAADQSVDIEFNKLLGSSIFSKSTNINLRIDGGVMLGNSISRLAGSSAIIFNNSIDVKRNLNIEMVSNPILGDAKNLAALTNAVSLAGEIGSVKISGETHIYAAEAAIAINGTSMESFEISGAVLESEVSNIAVSPDTLISNMKISGVKASANSGSNLIYNALGNTKIILTDLDFSTNSTSILEQNVGGTSLEISASNVKISAERGFEISQGTAVLNNVNITGKGRAAGGTAIMVKPAEKAVSLVLNGLSLDKFGTGIGGASSSADINTSGTKLTLLDLSVGIGGTAGRINISTAEIIKEAGTEPKSTDIVIGTFKSEVKQINLKNVALTVKTNVAGVISAHSDTADDRANIDEINIDGSVINLACESINTSIGAGDNALVNTVNITGSEIAVALRGGHVIGASEKESSASSINIRGSKIYQVDSPTPYNIADPLNVIFAKSTGANPSALLIEESELSFENFIGSLVTVVADNKDISLRNNRVNFANSPLPALFFSGSGSRISFEGGEYNLKSDDSRALISLEGDLGELRFASGLFNLSSAKGSSADMLSPINLQKGSLAAVYIDAAVMNISSPSAEVGGISLANSRVVISKEAMLSFAPFEPGTKGRDTAINSSFVDEDGAPLALMLLTVSDVAKNPVAGAEVTLTGTPSSIKTKATNAQGQAQWFVPQNTTPSVLVTKEGFANRGQEFTVAGLDILASFSLENNLLLIDEAPLLIDVGESFAKKVVTGGYPVFIIEPTSTMPEWASFKAGTGEIIGTGQVAGDFSLKLDIVDIFGNRKSGNIPVQVFEALAVAEIAEINAITGVNIGAKIGGTGGSLPYKYAISGAPQWLIVNPDDGNISGVAGASGSYTVLSTITDSRGKTASTQFKLNVSSAIVIEGVSQQTLISGDEIALTLKVSTGAAPYVFAIKSAPAWLSIDESGKLHGIAGEAGDYLATVTVADANGAIGELDIKFKIEPKLAFKAFSIPTFIIPNAGNPTAYLEELKEDVVGGKAPYKFTSPDADGKTVKVEAGGKVTISTKEDGKYEFSVVVTDASGDTASTKLSFEAAHKITILTVKLPDQVYKTPWSQIVDVSGGKAPYEYSLYGAPKAISIDVKTGKLTSDIKENGLHKFTVIVKDSLGQVAAYGYSLRVSGMPTDSGGVIPEESSAPEEDTDPNYNPETGGAGISVPILSLILLQVAGALTKTYKRKKL